jgi:DUF1707 SHOCT-like domain
MPATDRPRQTWFRMGPDLNMRVSDAERAEVADRLARHFADGRLDQAEFDERVSRAMAAKTVGDLRGLFDDLPDLPGDIPDDNAASPQPGQGRAPGMAPAAGCAARRRGLRRGPVRTVVLVALLLLAANITWHAVGFWVTPLAWVVIIAAIVVALSRHSHRQGE